MEKWTLTIEKVQNGFVLTGEGADNNGPYVIEEDDIDELKAFEDLAWQVWDFFSYYASKHYPVRLMIVRQKQK